MDKALWVIAVCQIISVAMDFILFIRELQSLGERNEIFKDLHETLQAIEQGEDHYEIWTDDRLAEFLAEHGMGEDDNA